MEMGWRAELGVKDLTMAFTGFIAEFDKRLVAIKLTLEKPHLGAEGRASGDQQGPRANQGILVCQEVRRSR